MIFNTLNSIVDDIILRYRQNNISESENINRAQIEQWCIQYRSFLIKQDIDKGRDINQSYIQEISSVPLTMTKYTNNISSSKNVLKSIKIPTTVDFHFKSGIVDVTDLFGNQIQLMSDKRAVMQSNRRHTGFDTVCYRKDGYIYVSGNDTLQYINVRGVFQNPFDVPGFTSADSEYPMPANMIPLMKELIFTKELNIQLKSDNKNDSSNEIYEERSNK